MSRDGMSGSPVFNMKGRSLELIGENPFLRMLTNLGMRFILRLPKKVVRQILAEGKSSYGWFGLRLVNGII